MFGLGGAKAPALRPGGGVDTLIAPDVVLRGELRFAGGLYLEGTLFGVARAEDGAAAHLTVAPRGRVEGEVHAPVVVVHGTVVGDIHASERLELGPGARVEGNLHYAVVQMAAGAAVTGQLLHRPKAPVGPVAPARAPEATPA